MPDPGRFKEKSKFISECIRTNINEGLDEEHAKGKCFGIWKNKGKKKSACEALRRAAKLLESM